MPCRNPCRLYFHLAFTYTLRWSLERSVKRTWTGSAFSTNESAWSVMVTGSQSRVRSGPNSPITLRSQCPFFLHKEITSALRYTLHFHFKLFCPTHNLPHPKLLYTFKCQAITDLLYRLWYLVPRTLFAKGVDKMLRGLQVSRFSIVDMILFVNVK